MIPRADEAVGGANPHAGKIADTPGLRTEALILAGYTISTRRRRLVRPAAKSAHVALLAAKKETADQAKKLAAS